VRGVSLTIALPPTSRLLRDKPRHRTTNNTNTNHSLIRSQIVGIRQIVDEQVEKFDGTEDEEDYVIIIIIQLRFAMTIFAHLL
jgi:hypothetical protein